MSKQDENSAKGVTDTSSTSAAGWQTPKRDLAQLRKNIANPEYVESYFRAMWDMVDTLTAAYDGLAVARPAGVSGEALFEQDVQALCGRTGRARQEYLKWSDMPPSVHAEWDARAAEPVLDDLTTVTCPTCEGSTHIDNGHKAVTCDDCDGQGKIIVSRKDLAAKVSHTQIATWEQRIQAAHPNSEAQYWPDSLKCKYMSMELEDRRAAAAATKAPVSQTHDTVDAAGLLKAQAGEPVAWMRNNLKECTTAVSKRWMENANFGHWGEIAKSYTIPLFAAPAEQTMHAVEPNNVRLSAFAECGVICREVMDDQSVDRKDEGIQIMRRINDVLGSAGGA